LALPAHKLPSRLSQRSHRRGIPTTLGDGTYTFAHVNHDKFVFSSAGQLLREVDRNGYTTALAYANGQLSTVTDPAGRSLSLSYGAGGKLASVTDAAGRHVDYGYDAQGNLTNVSDVGRGLTAFSYDANHLLLTIQDPNNGVLTNHYDAAGRVTSQTDPMHRTTTWAYTAGSTTITDPDGNVSLQQYAGGRKLVSVTNAYGTPQAATWTYAFDPATLGIASLADPNNNVAHYTWDPQGNLLSSKDSLNQTASYTYNAFGEPLTVTDPMNITTTNTYDANGNLLSRSTPVVDPQGIEPYGVSAVTSTYGDSSHPGDVTSVTDPNNQAWPVTYDTHGDIASVSDPLGDKTRYCYDTIGRRTAVIAPKGSVSGVTCSTASPAFTTAIAPNAFGDPLIVTDAVGNHTTYGYDGNRNLVAVKDGLNQTTTNVYDLDNAVTQTVRPDGTTVGYGYDPAGNRVAQINGLGVTTTYGYDPFHRVVSTTDGLGRTTLYGRDLAGNVITKQDPGGNCAATPATGCTKMTYDAANRLTRIDYSDGNTPSETFRYDADGRRLDMTELDNPYNNTATLSHYDSLGRLTSEWQNDNPSGLVAGGEASLRYAYDLAGHLTSISNQYQPGGQQEQGVPVSLLPGTLTRTYDAAGRMQSVTSWAGNTTRFGYDADSNLATIAYPNSTNASYSYDAADRTATIVDTGPGGVPFLTLPYSRDGNGRTATDNPASTPVAVAQTYGYDGSGRLASASLIPAPAPPTTGFGYDAADRLIQLAHAGQATAALRYDAADQLTTTVDPSGSTTGAYSYDAKGNRTRVLYPQLGVTATYAYDQANRLTSYTGPVLKAANQAGNSALSSMGPLVGAGGGFTSTQASYTYMPDGLRADMAWDRAEGLPLILSSPFVDAYQSGLQGYVTGPGGRVVEVDLLPAESPTGSIQGQTYTTTQTVYVHADAAGSTRVITANNGQPLVGYTYDPYGQETLTTLSSSTSPIVNPFLFQGQYVDPLTGFMYLRNRWYDPTTAQFLTKDPAFLLTRSLYGYAGGDPVNSSDPTGLCPQICPPMVEQAARFFGVGDIGRFFWHVAHRDATGRIGVNAGVSGIEQGVGFLLRIPFWTVGLPLTLGATEMDFLCTNGRVGG
jgi:RHS repeat-associated protein